MAVRDAFLSGGLLMYPLLLIAVGVLAVAARAALLLYGRGEASPATERWLQAILFWGAISVLVGLLGTAVGLIQMAQAVALAGSVHPPLVWGGLGVALVTSIFGMLIFLLCAVLWFVLRLRHQALGGGRGLLAGDVPGTA
jgi:hypothetical protein